MMYLCLLFSFLFPLAIMWIPASFKGQGNYAVMVRRSVLLIPYMAWGYFLDLAKMEVLTVYFGVFLSGVVVLIFLEKNDYLFKCSQNYAELAGPLQGKKVLVCIYNIIIFVVAEELFFRLGILSVIEDVWGIFLQAVAFVLAHRLTPWGSNFSGGDLGRQFLFSVAAGFYFLVTKDIFTCIMAHFLLNLPDIVHLIRRWRLSKLAGEEVNGYL